MSYIKPVIVSLMFILAALLGACSPSSGAPAAASVDLSQTFTGAESGLTLRYPTGWTAEEDSSRLTIYNDKTLFEQQEKDPKTLPAGLLMGTMMFVPTSGLADVGLSADAGPSDILAKMMEAGIGLEETEAVTTFDSNGKSAASVYGTMSQDDIKAQVGATIVPVSDGFVMLLFTGTGNVVKDNDATIRAIAGSIEHKSAQS